jgi:hypothetical protein
LVLFLDNDLYNPDRSCWTSGTSEGVLSADHPIWCGSNQFIDMQWDDWSSKPMVNRHMTIDVTERNEVQKGIVDDLATTLHDVFCENDHV